MSMTTSAGVFGAKYWVLMARVMARRLSAMIESQRIEPNFIPGGIYSESKLFFRLVTEAYQPKSLIATTRAASLNAYMIALHVVDEYIEHTPKDTPELSKRFERYAILNEKLMQSGRLAGDDLKLAEELLHFYSGLAHLGISERYHSGVGYHSSTRTLGMIRRRR